MNKLVIFIGLLLGSFSINAQNYFGKKIATSKNSIEASKIASEMANLEKLEASVTGTVEQVCQAAGCWMKIVTENGQTMRVTFKDYAFFVPKDIAGKKVVFEGIAQKTITSVDHLKHYAEDAGKSKAEIAKITKPEYSITFEAVGVIVE